MTVQPEGKEKREAVAWSACSTCIFGYDVDSDEARCSYDKHTQSWHHIDSNDNWITGACFREPEPMEVMV